MPHYPDTVASFSPSISLLIHTQRGSLDQVLAQLRFNSHVHSGYPSDHSGVMSESRALHIFLQVCYGVRALHEHNPPWAHRDLKVSELFASQLYVS